MRADCTCVEQMKWPAHLISAHLLLCSPTVSTIRQHAYTVPPALPQPSRTAEPPSQSRAAESEPSPLTGVVLSHCRLLQAASRPRAPYRRPLKAGPDTLQFVRALAALRDLI